MAEWRSHGEAAEWRSRSPGTAHPHSATYRRSHAPSRSPAAPANSRWLLFHFRTHRSFQRWTAVLVRPGLDAMSAKLKPRVNIGSPPPHFLARPAWACVRELRSRPRRRPQMWTPKAPLRPRGTMAGEETSRPLLALRLVLRSLMLAANSHELCKKQTAVPTAPAFAVRCWKPARVI